MDRKSRNLEELAALAQLYSAIQGPQIRQQESVQQNALAAIGLMMQQQNQQAQLAQRKEEAGLQFQNQQDVTTQRQRESDMRSGEFWGGELPAKYAAQQAASQDAAAARALASQDAAATRELTGQHFAGQLGVEQQRLTAEQRHQQAMEALGVLQLKQQQDADANTSNRAALGQFASLPGMTPEMLASIGSSMGNPAVANVNQALKQTVADTNLHGLQAMINPLLQNFSKNPTSSQQALHTILTGDPRALSPTVQPQLYDWLNQQYQVMPGAKPGMEAPENHSGLADFLTYMPARIGVGAANAIGGIGNAINKWLGIDSRYTPVVPPVNLNR